MCDAGKPARGTSNFTICLSARLSMGSPKVLFLSDYFETQVRSCVRFFLAASGQNMQKAPQMMVCCLFSVRRDYGIIALSNHSRGKSQDNSGVLCIFDLLNWPLCSRYKMFASSFPTKTLSFCEFPH